MAIPDDDTEELWMIEGSPTHETEWNFDPVPESELIACCFWEFARESKSINLLADARWCELRMIWYRKEYENDPALLEKHNEEVKRVEERLRNENFDYEGFLEKLWQTDFPAIGIYDAVTKMVRDGMQAWRRLPEDFRAHLVGKVSESRSLRPLCLAWIGELEELWVENSGYLMEIRSHLGDEKEDREEDALWTESTPIESKWASDRPESETVTAAITVDFSRFTDDEISDAFIDWLKSHRPERWKNPRRVLPGCRQRGRKLVEYRVALERLGLMRLLHWHSPSDLRKNMPGAWSKICRKEHDFRREVREAGKFFRALFPFLPEGERPFSEERFGVWMPEMLKIMERVEKEMGL